MTWKTLHRNKKRKRKWHISYKQKRKVTNIWKVWIDEIFFTVPSTFVRHIRAYELEQSRIEMRNKIEGHNIKRLFYCKKY